LQALRAARRLGDWLTVGVITDDYKEWFIAHGPLTYKKTPPVIPYKQRAEIVASLRCVDEIVPHCSLGDNVDFIIREGFSIRAHGPDYGTWLGQTAVRDYLELMGVKYVLIPRTPNISTTMIKRRIKQHEKVSSDSGHCRNHAGSMSEGNRTT